MQVEKQQKKKNMLQGCINGQQEPEFGPDTEKNQSNQGKKRVQFVENFNFWGIMEYGTVYHNHDPKRRMLQ